MTEDKKGPMPERFVREDDLGKYTETVAVRPVLIRWDPLWGVPMMRIQATTYSYEVAVDEQVLNAFGIYRPTEPNPKTEEKGR